MYIKQLNEVSTYLKHENMQVPDQFIFPELINSRLMALLTFICVSIYINF